LKKVYAYGMGVVILWLLLLGSVYFIDFVFPILGMSVEPEVGFSLGAVILASILMLFIIIARSNVEFVKKFV
jgi:hypothetical protein